MNYLNYQRYHFFVISGIILIFFSLIGLKSSVGQSNKPKEMGVELMVLGTVQDAGSPHIACKKDCCKELFETGDQTRMVVSLGLSDYKNQKQYIFDASPDITRQLNALKAEMPSKEKFIPDAVFLTHAHIGHYTGLMYFGREAIGAKGLQVYAMPRMKKFLQENGPWSQLVELGNIKLNELKDSETLELTSSIQIQPLLVPHRDEYSETVGYLIKGPNKTALFLPDIDKWKKWNLSIDSLIQTVDYAFLDATFYSNKEVNNRNMEEIPHPFVIESMDQFSKLSKEDKEKVFFIHFNHTNPILLESSSASENVRKLGFNIARKGMKFLL